MKDKFLVTLALALLSAIHVAPSAQTTAKPASANAVVYAAVGPDLTQYDVDVSRASLEKRGTVRLPANVQEAVMHRSGRHLYVAWSNRGASYGTGGAVASEGRHGVTAFRVNASGMLAASDSSITLRSRPIHVTTDIKGAHLLVAYNDPSGVSVHRIQGDGTIGAEVQPPRPSTRASTHITYACCRPTRRSCWSRAATDRPRAREKIRAR
jgi:6-phosphogluconolactonase